MEDKVGAKLKELEARIKALEKRGKRDYVEAIGRDRLIEKDSTHIPVVEG